MSWFNRCRSSRLGPRLGRSGRRRMDRRRIRARAASSRRERRQPGRVRAHPGRRGGAAAADWEPLCHFNGIGGFTGNGREYVIRLEPDGASLRYPPMPWINVIANESFGFLASETGAGYTWSLNSREHRLTPWSNDPVVDPHGEALYLRDEDSGRTWSPMPGPMPSGESYETRHGFGYTRYLHRCDGLAQETCVFVPRHDSVKVVQVRITNHRAQRRRLSLVSFSA